ncbi:unnamed protein product [Phaedon cochleariae]|uniref:Uncharacterized protein n=1 Tax=Phaedon cochleariae TaxID=80249 RepID=A0A9P0DQ28_PHACE|nr:unnamed protein product [Phaedon cochleariae]
MFFMKKNVFLVSVSVILASFGYHHAEVYRIGVISDLSDAEQQRALFKSVSKAVREINEREMIFLDVKTIEIPKDNSFEAVRATCSLLEQGVVGIFGPFTEDNSNVVQSICDLKEIPHIEVRWDDHSLNGTIVNVHPYPDMLTRTYYDIIINWKWNDFVILYENNESLQRVGELLKLFEPSKQRIVVRQLELTKTTEGYREILKEVRKSGATHFVLDCSIEILEEVLKEAQQVGLMTNKHNFIITNLDLHTIDLKPFMYSETNITGMRCVNIEKLLENTDQPLEVYKMKLKEALIHDGIKMFAEALSASETMVRPFNIDCYNASHKLSSGTTIINLMKGLEYPGLTGPVKFDIKGYRSNFALDIFELMEGGQTIVGHWNSSMVPALNISRKLPPSEDDNDDIRNRTFKVEITLTEPYGMRVESSEPLYGNEQYEGFAVDLIKELAAMRGFNYTFTVREDKANGKFDNNTGRWTGIIGDLIDGVSLNISDTYLVYGDFLKYFQHADLAICDLTITMERAAVVDFTVPFMMLGVSILYKKPTKAPPSFFSFADPFAFEVWQLLIVCWVGVSVIIFVVGRISPAEWENPYPCIEEPEYLVNQLDFRNSLWFVTGSIMQQGSEIELKSVGTRMVAGMWWFFTLLMVSSYTANLAAFLATENPDPHFTNLKELVDNAESKEIIIGAKAGGATETFFRDKYVADPTSDFGKAWVIIEKYKDQIKIPDNKDGVAQAQKGHYAFFMEDTSIEYETQRKCDLNQVGGKLDEKGYGIAMRRNSSYRHSLSTAILILQNSGKIGDIKRKWWEERKGGGQCYADSESADATPLNLSGVEGVFWVTIGGTIVAIFMAILETLLQITRKSIKTKTPFCSVLMEEIRFYFRFGEMEKQMVYPDHSEESPTTELPYGFVLEKQMSADRHSCRSKRSKSRISRSRAGRSRSRSRRSGSRKFDKQLSANTS